MRGSLAGFLTRRVVALVATVVIAPTFAWTVFNGLGGNLGERSLPGYAWDYAVTTFWHLDLGYTGTYDAPVASVIWWSLPADLGLLLGGIAWGLALGVAGGIFCAARPGTLPARTLGVVQSLMLASPPYWLGFMLLLFFAPGTGSVLELPFLSEAGAYVTPRHDLLGWVRSLWLPALMVGLPLAAGVLRMVEGALREALGEDFLRTARAKGVAEGLIMRRHAFPLALGPTLALIGVSLPAVITNVALMEGAFNIPGIYREIRRLGNGTDYALLQAMIIETTVIIVVANMAVDAIQARLDPTVR